MNLLKQSGHLDEGTLWYLIESMESEYKSKSLKAKGQLGFWRKHSQCLKYW